MALVGRSRCPPDSCWSQTMTEYQVKKVWASPGERAAQLSRPPPSPSQLAGLWLAHPPLRSGLVLQDESGRLLRTWAALAASQRPLVAPGRHCCHTLLHPLVSGMGSKALLLSAEHFVCARHSSNCFYALSHFILILPCYYLHLTDEKVETQGSKPRQSDLTTTRGILKQCLQ